MCGKSVIQFHLRPEEESDVATTMFRVTTTMFRDAMPSGTKGGNAGVFHQTKQKGRPLPDALECFSRRGLIGYQLFVLLKM
jgi:hypothetical protein